LNWSTRPPLLGLLAALSILLCSCGSGDSGEQAKLEHARREGAAAARHADQIRQLQKDVAALRSERAATPEAAPSSSLPQGSPEATDARIPESGAYSGEARQRGTPARLNKNYPVQMSFSSTGSHVSYPTLACEGQLRPLGFEAANRVYEEQITSGHCDGGGIWLVHVDGPTTLEGSWSLPSASYTVTAVLAR